MSSMVEDVLLTVIVYCGIVCTLRVDLGDSSMVKPVQGGYRMAKPFQGEFQFEFHCSHDRNRTKHSQEPVVHQRPYP